MEQENNRHQFGNRHLTTSDDVFAHNAWDDAEWDDEQRAKASKIVEDQLSSKMSDTESEGFLNTPLEHWDKFYAKHQENFFKDRNWLFTEFPELSNESTELVFEVGCGVGNTVFPIVQSTSKTFVYAADYSSVAVDLLKQHPIYDPKRCHAFACDVTDTGFSYPFEENSLDFIVMIFVLSAIKRSEVENVVRHLTKFLKPGGMFLIRDYGRYDMAQLRFKPSRCIAENSYVRGDGTLAYFFDQSEMESIFENCGLVKVLSYTDSRLQVNRGKQLKMYRMWIECKYMKPAL